MKKARKKLSRRWKPLLETVLLLVLLFVCWIIQDCPRFTATSAFRRALRANLRPDAPLVLELPMEDQDREWAVGWSSGKAYEVFLKQTRLCWQNEYCCGVDADDGWWSDPATLLEFPTTEDLCCVPLFWYSLVDPSSYSAPTAETPALALKAEPEAARAEATLRVEVYEPYPDTPQLSYPAGSCELVPLGQQEGWFLFGFDAATLNGAGNENVRSVNRSLVLWVSRWAAAGANTGTSYHSPVQAGSLEIRLYDESDRLLRTVTVTP